MKENVIEKISKILGKYRQKISNIVNISPIFCRFFFFIKKIDCGFSQFFLLEISCSSCFENVEKEEKERKRKKMRNKMGEERKEMEEEKHTLRVREERKRGKNKK